MIMKMMTRCAGSWRWWQGHDREDADKVCSVHVSEDEQQFLLIGGNADGLLGGTRVAQYDPARGDFEKWDSLYTERWDLTAPEVSLGLINVQPESWPAQCSGGAMPVRGLVILSLLLAGWFIITDIAINHHYHHHHVRLWQYWGYSCWTQQMLLNSGESFLHNHGLYNFVGSLHSVSTLNSLFSKFKFLLIFVNLRCITFKKSKYWTVFNHHWCNIREQRDGGAMSSPRTW